MAEWDPRKEYEEDRARRQDEDVQRQQEMAEYDKPMDSIARQQWEKHQMRLQSKVTLIEPGKYPTFDKFVTVITLCFFATIGIVGIIFLCNFLNWFSRIAKPPILR